MILYVTKIDRGNIGADMHYRALCEIYGKKNIFTINLSLTECEKHSENYISYGKYKTVAERLKRWIQIGRASCRERV